MASVTTKGVAYLDSITSLIKNEIKKQYGSVKKFSDKSGIPYSTLSNALNKGVGGTSYDTVVKICKLLNIKQVFNENISLFNEQFYEIYSMLSSLDEQGLHTVQTVLSVEYNRYRNSSSPAVKSFSGVGFAIEGRTDASCNLSEGSGGDGKR